jgi:hypothetical protein
MFGTTEFWRSLLWQKFMLHSEKNYLYIKNSLIKLHPVSQPVRAVLALLAIGKIKF